MRDHALVVRPFRLHVQAESLHHKIRIAHGYLRFVYLSADGKGTFDFRDLRNNGRSRGRLVFSADARRFCYFRKTVGKWLLVTDQGSVDPLGDAADSTAAFSPNGRHLAYSSERNGKQIVVLDGKAGPEFDSLILPPFFVSDDVLEYVAAKDESCIKVRTTFIPAVDRR